MPIITTLETGRGLREAFGIRVARRQARGRSLPLQFFQAAVGHPDLADDLGHGQVAVEALAARRAELAVERAADLRGHAERAAIVFGNEDGLDAVAPMPTSKSHFTVPSAERCSERIAGARTSAIAFSFSRSDFARSVIASKSATAALVDPLEHLARAKRLLALRGQPLGERGQGEVEEV